MIEEDRLYDIEDTIIEADKGSEDFLKELITQKSQLALWLTSENFELFSEREFASLVLLTQVLIAVYKQDVNIAELEIDEIADIEESYYDILQSKGRENATVHLSQSSPAQNQPKIYDYLIMFIEDVQETLELDK